MAQLARAEDTGGPDVYFDSSFREALIDVVNNCLNHKPDNVPVDQYFADHLEPILSALAVDCITSQPENPVIFLQEWAKQHEEAYKGACFEVSQDVDLDISPIARMALTSWHHKEQAQELEILQRHYGLLKEALASSQRGCQILRAAETGDRSSLFAILEPLGLARSTDGQYSATSAQVLELLGKVLRCLRNRGVTSASSAFSAFSPEQDWTIPVQRMHAELRHLQVLQEDEVKQLVRNLDHAGTGKISYRDFRTLVVRFLATSRDFHYALSPEEFNALMFRIEARLASNGTTVGQALSELDASKTGALSDAEFMYSLRLLRLGLSNKEVAQVFNSLSANSFRAAGTAELPNPVMRGQVSIALFEALVEKCSKENFLKDRALSSFSKLRETLARSVKPPTSWIACLRQYADPPLRQYLNFGAFSGLLMDVDSSMTSAEIGRLWCVLEKDDFSDEPLARIEELLRWMGPVS